MHIDDNILYNLNKFQCDTFFLNKIKNTHLFRSQDRSTIDLDIIYEELINIKALSHLPSLVKKELSAYLFFEAHPYQNTVIFRQGDKGTSWYIILKGSVDVSIHGKGKVTTLHEGEEFGKLSLVNDCPRTATITTADINCHLLRVDKSDFNRLIRDCEAYNIQLKEFDKTVLMMQKLPINTKSENMCDTPKACYKYSLTFGTPEKILEHLLETRIQIKIDDKGLMLFFLTKTGLI